MRFTKQRTFKGAVLAETTIRPGTNRQASSGSSQALLALQSQ